MPDASANGMPLMTVLTELFNPRNALVARDGFRTLAEGAEVE
jgi:hypothetical protein